MDDEASWSAPRWLYPCLLVGSAVTLYFRASAATKSGSASRLPPLFMAFQRRFLNVFFLALAAYGLQNVYSEVIYKRYGFQRKQMAIFLVVEHAAALCVGTFISLSADYIGRRKICCAFAILQILESVFKQLGTFYALCLARFCNGVAASVFYCAFETWMISEHEKLGFRQEWLADTFWLMNFGGAIVSLASTALANVLVGDFGLKLAAPSAVAAAVALLCAVFISNSWSENVGDGQGRYPKAIWSTLQAFRDKRVVVLGLVQASFDISVSAFWLLWIPTIVADGREIHAGSVYASLMASVMLGSAVAALLLCGPLFSSPESFLPAVFAIASICLMVPAYDYQEIAVLVASFCVFHVCVGVAAPSLARLRSIYIPNGHRAGVLAVYHVPVNVALVIFLVKGSRLQFLENSTILWLCALGNLAGAAGLHVLNTWRVNVADKFAYGDDLKEHMAQ